MRQLFAWVFFGLVCAATLCALLRILRAHRTSLTEKISLVQKDVAEKTPNTQTHPFPNRKLHNQTLIAQDILQHVLYINLARRVDRLKEIQSVLNELHIEHLAQRIEGVDYSAYPELGCALSHVKALDVAIEHAWDSVLILEDDFCLAPDQTFESFFSALVVVAQYFQDSDTHWDVLLLAGNNYKPFFQVENCDRLVQVHNCQTTAAFWVRKHYVSTLRECFAAAAERMEADLRLRNPHRLTNGIDFAWKRLQRRDAWFLVVPVLGTQRPSHSDIERKAVNYTSAMLRWDK